MKPDMTWTCAYETLFYKALQFICNNDTNNNDHWIPNLVIICAGYDALASDELANTNLIATDYNIMTILYFKYHGHC